MQETQVQSLGQEDPLEEEMATHSSILVWKIPWTEEPGRLQSMGSQIRTQLSEHKPIQALQLGRPRLLGVCPGAPGLNSEAGEGSYFK